MYRSVFLDEVVDIEMDDLLSLPAVLLDGVVLIVDLTSDAKQGVRVLIEVVLHDLLEVSYFRDLRLMSRLLSRLLRVCRHSSVEVEVHVFLRDIPQLVVDLAFHFLRISSSRWVWHESITSLVCPSVFTSA